MYGNSIGKFQFLQLLERVFCTTTILKLYSSCLRKFIDFFHNTGISVENAYTFINRYLISSKDLPLKLVVIFYLHDLIALAEKSLADLFFFFLIIRWIEISLQDLVQTFHSQKSLSHWCQNLDLIWLRIYITGQFLLDQRDHYTDNNICVISLQEKEIPALIVDRHLFTVIDLMCIHNDIALGSLAEDLLQFHHRKTSAPDDITKHISRTHTRKLILIAYQDQPGSCCHCKKKRMHQCNIHHRHLVNNDHICFQRIF